MAKLAKKTVLKTKDRQTIKKMKNKFKLKDCCVKLIRLSKKDIEMYSNTKIITKTFDVRISGESVQLGDVVVTSKNQSFNFKIRKHLFDLIIEPGEVEVDLPIKISSKAVPNSIPNVQEANMEADTTQKMPSLIGKALNDLINSKWRQIKKQFRETQQTVALLDLVMAKMSGYSAWAGRIESFTKNKKSCQVYFFGTNNRGSVSVNEIIPFELCNDVIRLLLLRKMGEFHKSIIEIEKVLGIPYELSLTKEILSIKN